MTTLENNWDKVAEALGKTVQETVEIVALETHRRIAERTPVDTGRAKAGWMITETLDSTVADNTTVQFSRSRLSGESKVPLPSKIYIVNAVPYIVYLEDGWSKQAPLGMVRITVAEMEAKLSVIATAQISQAGGAVA